MKSSRARLLWFIYFFYTSIAQYSWRYIGHRMREGGCDTWQRAPGRDLNPGPLQRGQSSCTWDTCSTSWAKRRPMPGLFLTEAAPSCAEQIVLAGSQRHGNGIEYLVNLQNKTPCADQLFKNEKWPAEQKFVIYVLKLKCSFLWVFLVCRFRTWWLCYICNYLFCAVYSWGNCYISWHQLFYPCRSALCWTNYIITTMLNYPKHVFLHYTFQI